MNRSTVISMVQDLTEHKADQRIDFNNLFNLRLVKFIQKKPFWWRKKIFSFSTQPGVATYDFANLQIQGDSWPLIAGGVGGTPGVVTIAGAAPPPADFVTGAQVILSQCVVPEYNGGPFTLTSVSGPDAYFAQPAGYVTDGHVLTSGLATTYSAPQVLASDLESFIKVELWLNGLKYGCLEPNFDIEDISDQQENTTTGPPSTYCIEPGTLTTLRIMPTPDQAYKVKSSYWACPQPADDFSDGTIPLIPAMYHHGLVSGLKMDVTGFLYGEKSDLYEVAVKEYQESIEAAEARQDFSNKKMVQYIISDDAVASTPGN